MKKALVLLTVAIALTLSACAPGGDVMTPVEARDQTNSVLDGTIAAAGAADWVRDRNGSPIPEECTVDGAGGVTFGHGAYARVSGEDPAADAQRVADYWTSIGIETRIVSDPTPTVFGRGGPVNAISFGTAPGYTISLGGVCVPGDPFDYYDDTPTPAPSS